jgi:hypothetical protein
VSNDFYDEFFFGERKKKDPDSKSETDRRKRERIRKFEERMRGDAHERRQAEEARKAARQKEQAEKQRRVEEARAERERRRLAAELAREEAERARLEATDPFAKFRSKKITEQIEDEAKGEDPGVPPRELFFGKRKEAEEISEDPADQAKRARLRAFEQRLQKKAADRRRAVEREQAKRKRQAELKHRAAEERRKAAAKRQLEEKLARERAEQAKLEQGDPFAKFRKKKLSDPDYKPPLRGRRRI